MNYDLIYWIFSNCWIEDCASEARGVHARNLIKQNDLMFDENIPRMFWDRIFIAGCLQNIVKNIVNDHMSQQVYWFEFQQEIKRWIVNYPEILNIDIVFFVSLALTFCGKISMCLFELVSIAKFPGAKFVQHPFKHLHLLQLVDKNISEIFLLLWTQLTLIWVTF